MVRDAVDGVGAAAGGGFAWIADPVLFLAGPRDFRDQFFGVGLEHENNPSIGFHVLEDQVHHDLNDLLDIKARSEGGGKLIEDLEVGHCSGGGLRDGQDKGVIR